MRLGTSRSAGKREKKAKVVISGGGGSHVLLPDGADDGHGIVEPPPQPSQRSGRVSVSLWGRGAGGSHVTDSYVVCVYAHTETLACVETHAEVLRSCGIVSRKCAPIAAHRRILEAYAVNKTRNFTENAAVFVMPGFFYVLLRDRFCGYDDDFAHRFWDGV